jgi:HPt (histidine-containing phosphotransfer) domain-containing protein
MQNCSLNYDHRLDLAYLEKLYENDKDYAAFGFEQFLKHYPDQIHELEESFKSGDVNTFRQKIHKLKPTFSFVGLTGLTTKAETIEKNCTELTEITTLNDLYQDFKNTLQELIPIVKNEYSRLNT